MHENSKIVEVLSKPYSLIRLRKDGLIEISSMHNFHILTPTQLNEFWDIISEALGVALEYGEDAIIQANNKGKELADKSVQNHIGVNPAKKYSQYCYVIKDTTRYIYKIGSANSIENRLSAIKTANPYIELVYVISGAINEKLLHKHFAGQRITREWFNLSDTDLLYIQANYAITSDYK